MPASSKIIVNTGNVLNLIEIKQKAGQNVTEELVESLQITVADWEKNKTAGIAVTQNGTVGEGVKAGTGRVVMTRRQDDLLAKMAEEDRKNLKIGVKVFVEDDSIASLVDCLENVYETLDIEAIDNLVLAYNPAARTEGVGSDLTNGDAQATCDRILPGLKVLWSTLEEKYVKTGRMLQLGVADIEEACFKSLHSWSSVQPTIVQINLSSCCVVPPGLQAFCKENDVQLLTHSDPQEIISSKVLGGILGANVEFIDWCVRFQVHIRCRGVLSLKGYITCATVDQL